MDGSTDERIGRAITAALCAGADEPPCHNRTVPNDSPRVLMVTPRSPLGQGGVERHVMEVSRRLASAGVHVEVLCSDPGGRAAGEQIAAGVLVRAVRAWPADRDWCFAPGLWRAIARADADVVHVQSYHTFVGPTAMLRAWTLGIPYLLTFHGGGHSLLHRNRLRRLQRLLLRPLLAHASRLVAVAPFEIEQYGRELRIPAERFALIPNGSDLTAADLGIAGSSNGHSSSHGPVIATIGRLERYKGHHRVIAALPYVLEQRPDARIVVVGSGPYEQELRAAAAAAGVVDRVEFTSVPAGDRRGMWDLLQSVSLVALLSDFETHPITALEAASAHRRLLVSRRGGLIDLINDGTASGIEPDAPPREVASAIVAGLDRPAPTKTPLLSTWEQCASALLDLYRSVARPGPPPTGRGIRS